MIISDYINGCRVYDNSEGNFDERFGWIVQYQCPVCHVDGTGYLEKNHIPAENELILLHCQMSKCNTNWYGRLHYENPVGFKKIYAPQTQPLGVFRNIFFDPNYIPKDKDHLTPEDMDKMGKFQIDYACPICKRRSEHKLFLSPKIYDNPPLTNQAIALDCEYEDCPLTIAKGKFYGLVRLLKKNKDEIFDEVSIEDF